MSVAVKVIEDSISVVGKRITTLQVRFHRYILPEFNTHRVFSRNFSSSRAIPTKKLIQQVLTEYAQPVHWGKNEAGMQAHEELQGLNKENAKDVWRMAATAAAGYARMLSEIGAHKQIVNRVIEPFLYVDGIVTATEWDNWFELRAHEDAQPEIHELALHMREAMDISVPRLLQAGEWHLPYTSDEEKATMDLELLKKVSAARCCRVSYLKHDGSVPNVEEDLALFDRLAGAVPLHASPLEHQATPVGSDIYLTSNLQGYNQFRKFWETEVYNNK